MKNSREPYILYPYVGVIPTGYTVIHRHIFRDDNYPKKKCSYMRISGDYELKKANVPTTKDAEESYKFYLIKTNDARNFLNEMNKAENKYDADIVQMLVERDQDDEQMLTANDRLPRLSNSAIERLAAIEMAKRKPKITYKRTQPIS